MINDCLYAGKITDGYLHFTLLRGAGYCFHPIGDRELYPKDRYLPRIENGRYEYNFRIYKSSLEKICAQAELFNQQPYAINLFPIGGSKKSFDFSVDGAINMSTCKIFGDGYTMRFFNVENTRKSIDVTFGGKSTTVEFAPYEIVTVKYMDDFIVLRNDFLK